MKREVRFSGVSFLVFSALVLGLWVVPCPKALADDEIQVIEETSPPTPTPTLAVVPAAGAPEATATPTTGKSEGEKPEPTATSEPEKPKVKVATGFVKMKDFYDAGVKQYKAQDYEKAITYFKKSLDIKDGYTKDYYYAEANAMLGVIYQFYMQVPNHRSLARQYYEAALKIDPETETAKLHLGEVSGADPE